MTGAELKAWSILTRIRRLRMVLLLMRTVCARVEEIQSVLALSFFYAFAVGPTRRPTDLPLPRIAEIDGGVRQTPPDHRLLFVLNV